MIKVKIDRSAPNVFYVVDGYTVSYIDNVLEVQNEDEEVIAVFRDWIYAMPADEIEEEPEEEEDLLQQTLTLPEIDVLEGDFLPDLDTASPVRANSHGIDVGPGDETEVPTS